MYIYIGKLLTGNLDLNKNMFGPDVIDMLLHDQDKVPVRINFTGDPIGHTRKFYTDAERTGVFVEFGSDIPHLDELLTYVVPGGHCDVRDLKTEPNGVRIITNYTLTEVSITSAPADPNLTRLTTNEKEVSNEKPTSQS